MIFETYLINKIETFFQKNIQKKENEIWVSDIVHYYYPTDFSNIPNLSQLALRGNLIHLGIQEVVKDDFFCEVPIKLQISGYIIKGKIDLLYKKFPIIVEIKTSSRIYESQVFQLGIYSYIFFKHFRKKPVSFLLLVNHKDLYIRKYTYNYNEIKKKILNYIIGGLGENCIRYRDKTRNYLDKKENKKSFVRKSNCQ